MSLLLIDTNVPIYALDPSDPRKQQIAEDVLDRLAQDPGFLTTQVLGEYFVTATRRIPSPLTPDQALARIQYFATAWTVLVITPTHVEEAVRGVRDFSLSYWDAQLWAAARLHDIPVVLSEDFSDGSLIEGVRFVNPFAVGFRLDDWL